MGVQFMITKNGATDGIPNGPVYLCWAGFNTKGTAEIQPEDVVPAVNAGMPLIRIRGLNQYEQALAEFQTPGDEG